jgi:hypothetical protein
MDGQCGLDAERFKAPVYLYLQVLAADPKCGYRIVTKVPLRQRLADYGAFLRHVGRRLPAEKWGEDQIEALRIENEDGQIFVYSMYDRACEFFGVKVLNVNHMPAFKYAVALGLVT